MKKLAVLTAVVLLFGVAGFAAAEQGGGNNNNDHQNQDPAIQANNNDLVGAKGEQAAAANDGSLAVNVAVDKDVNIDKDQSSHERSLDNNDCQQQQDRATSTVHRGRGGEGWPGGEQRRHQRQAGSLVDQK